MKECFELLSYPSYEMYFLAEWTDGSNFTPKIAYIKDAGIPDSSLTQEE